MEPRGSHILRTTSFERRSELQGALALVAFIRLQLLKFQRRLCWRWVGCAARFLRSLLLPKPRRRGRPGLNSVTAAINLLGKVRKRYPGEPWPKIWQWIYPEAIANYAGMNAVEQKHSRQVLRERVRWRLRDRRRRKNRYPIWKGKLP